MKKILFRKLLLDCLKFFLISSIGIASIVWVFQAVNYLDIMVEDGRNYLVYLKYTFLNFPKIIGKIYPFALFLSFYFVISKYEKSNELLIFWNHGVSKIEVINFLFKSSLILMIFQICLQSFLVPKTQDLARSTLRNSNVNIFENFVKPKKFNDVIKNVTIYSEKKNEDGTLENIFIKRATNPSEFEILIAKTGIIKIQNGFEVLVMYDGKNIKSKENNLDSFSFSKFDFNLSNLKANTITYKKTQENSSIDLIKCYQSLNSKNIKTVEIYKVENCTYKNLYNILGELYKRIIIPLYIPILILISLLLILFTKENLNYIKIKFLIFLLGFSIIVFSETTLRFVTGNLKENLILIILPFLLILMFYWIIIYKNKINFIKL